MKKKILSVTFAVAIMTVAAFNVYINQTKASLSELALANIEALASSENEEEETCGTGSKPTDPLTTCPQCKVKCGLDGTNYFRTTGNDTQYKDGFEGWLHYCGCNSHAPVEFKAKTRNCSE